MTTPATPFAFQMLPDFKGKVVKAPLACQTCGEHGVLDQNHQRVWLCPGCMMGAVDFGLLHGGLGLMGF